MKKAAYWSLTSVTIPGNVTRIGDGAFEGCNMPTLTISHGSYANEYAIKNNIPYTCLDETTD